MKISNDSIGDRTRDLPTCSAVPQLTGATVWPQPKKKTLVVTFSGQFLFYTVRYTSYTGKVIAVRDKKRQESCIAFVDTATNGEHINIKGRRKSVSGRPFAWDSPLDSCSRSSNGRPITKHTICGCNKRAILGITNTIHELWKQ